MSTFRFSFPTNGSYSYGGGGPLEYVIEANYQAAKAGNKKALAQLQDMARSGASSGKYANAANDALRALGDTSVAYADPNRPQSTPVAGRILQLGGLAAAGIGAGALAGIGPAAAGGAGAAGTAGTAATAAGVAGAAQKAGGVLGAIKEYGPLVLGGLGAINSASQQGQANDLQRQALQYAAQDYAARQPLRDLAMQRLQAPQAQRPDLAPIFSQSSNPYTQARYGKVGL